ncbi:MAG: ATP-binding cassette domain-containing protein [Bacilli bacterium]|nr:ATP-binding cassette domain-containing protein [Bacilli bacterium]
MKQYETNIDDENEKADKIEEINREYSSEAEVRRVKLEKLNEELKTLKAEFKASKKVEPSEEVKKQIEEIRTKYASERDAIRDNIDKVEREQIEAIAQIKYDNKHVDHKLMSKMQMIFQDPVDSLDPRMTVEDIIQEGLHIQGQYNRYKNSQKVKEVLVKVGLLPEYASRYPHEFSGGQRQRIGIARALIMNPQFLICDEPISALDVSIRAQIINLLNDLKEEMGLTILFIAHDLSVVKYFCDRIAVMYYGEIVELASSDELFAHPLHPYTHALLSAIPKPDPLSEKTRTRYLYIPSKEHDYSKEAPKLTEITPGHWVLANSEELAKYKEKLK